jgi:hypothetical protein
VVRRKFLYLVVILLTYNTLHPVQTISLAVTQHPVSTKTVSPLPSYGVGVLASSAALYCSSWGGRFFNSKPGAVVNNWIDTGINLVQKRFLSEKILHIYAHDKEAHKESALYCSVAALLYWGVKVSGQGYFIYKIGSVAQTLTYLGAHRTIWVSQLVHSLQEQIKLIALLCTVKKELKDQLEAVNNTDLRTMIVSHISQIESAIQRYYIILSTTFKKIEDMNGQCNKKLLNEECANGLKAVQEDFIKLAYGNIITRQDLRIIAERLNIAPIIDQLYDIEQLMMQKDEASCWKGVRTMQMTMRSLTDQVETIIKKQHHIMNNALSNGERLLSWRSFFKFFPIIRSLIN